MAIARESTKEITGELAARVAAEKEALLDASPHVDVEKIKIQFQVYEEYREQPPLIKRAAHFNRLCREKTIFIDANPLAGTLTRFKYGSYPISEFGSRWLKKTDSFSLQRGRAEVSAEDLTWLRRAADYWRDANVFNRTKSLVLDTMGVDIGQLQARGLGTEYTPGGFANVTPDFETVLKRGLNGILDDIAARVAALDMSQAESTRQWQFYHGARMALEGVITLAERYADLAGEMAAAEADPARRVELEEIAARCRRVPAHPARDFREALQSAWFLHLAVWIEAPFVLNSPPGRLVNHLYPWYRTDIESGAIDEAQAIAWLQFYFLKINGLAQVLPPHGYAWSQSRLGQHLCIGGLTPEGDDATTELDWLVLEAQRQLQVPEPQVALLYHPGLSPDFLLQCTELIKTGIGQPAVYDVEKALARHLDQHGMPLAEARGFAVVGCVQSWVPGCSLAPWEGALNVAKMLELALNNGTDPLSGQALGPKTGRAGDFKTYADLEAAFTAQVKHFLPLQRHVGATAWRIERESFPLPFASAVTGDCVARGADVLDGGARYHAANAMTFVGTVDTANSLAAIKKIVYEDKTLTLDELVQVLADDFEGHEDIWRRGSAAPKYGNDDPGVDGIARAIYDLLYEEHQRFPDFLGRASKPEAYSVTTHYATGRFTGALPYGRRSGLPLTDGSVSASPGTDAGGITALVRSAARLIDTVKWGGNHFNLKFHPSVFRTSDGARALLALLKTYFDLGGYHAQFNCVTAETLLQAQQRPDEYRHLIVRVAGFSAFFIHLDRLVQDEIIRRTEHSF